MPPDKELSSARFAGNQTLLDCLNERDQLRFGRTGDAVRLVQQALIDLGFAIPDGATGNYFAQTSSAVVSYKTARGLQPSDPVVGTKTTESLDREIEAFDHGHEPVPPPPVPPPPAILKSVTFWINAFIPDPSMTPFVVAAPGSSAGLSMIVIPANVPGLPIPSARCFLGDNRGFSNDPAASARIHSLAEVGNLENDPPQLVRADNVCGESVEIDLTSGDRLQAATAPIDRLRFLHLRGNTSVDPEGGVVTDSDSPRFVQLDYEAAANLPLLPITPDIDMLGILQIDRDAARFRFRGAVDGFPAFEAYVSFNHGPAITLFQRTPVAPLELVGDVKRNIDVTVPIAL